MGSISEKYHDHLKEERLQALIERLDEKSEDFGYMLETYIENPERYELEIENCLWLIENRDHIISQKSFITQLIPSSSKV